VAATLGVVEMAAGYFYVTASVLTLAFMGYMAVKHRAFVAKALLTVVRKVTRSKR
jgi:hypothetical protein